MARDRDISKLREVGHLFCIQDHLSHVLVRSKANDFVCFISTVNMWVDKCMSCACENMTRRFVYHVRLALSSVSVTLYEDGSSVSHQALCVRWRPGREQQ